MGDIIAKILAEQADCILLRPDWPKAWVALLPSLPIRHTVTLPVRSPTGAPLPIFVPGPRVPADKRHNSQPRYRVLAHLIIW